MIKLRYMRQFHYAAGAICDDFSVFHPISFVEGQLFVTPYSNDGIYTVISTSNRRVLVLDDGWGNTKEIEEIT